MSLPVALSLVAYGFYGAYFFWSRRRLLRRAAHMTASQVKEAVWRWSLSVGFALSVLLGLLLLMITLDSVAETGWTSDASFAAAVSVFVVLGGGYWTAWVYSRIMWRYIRRHVTTLGETTS